MRYGETAECNRSIMTHNYIHQSDLVPVTSQVPIKSYFTDLIEMVELSIDNVQYLE